MGSKADMALMENGGMVGKKEEKKEKEKERETWSGRLDFLMSALSFAVGMGNLWRFPYLCYKNGGGAFLIPYIIMVIFAGFPLIYLEMSIGQYASLGVVSVWRAAPLFQGIGWAMFFVSLISCCYYNMLVAYSFFYTFASFASDVPWRNCGNSWNTIACGSVGLLEAKNCSSYNGTWWNGTCYTVDQVGTDVYQTVLDLKNKTNSTAIKPISASDEYFHNYMLDISSGIEELGELRWQLALCLLLCWIIVFICLSTGVKSLGKATYVTSLFPYLILAVLFVRGITLEGSVEGIIYYLKPEFHRLLSAQVWADAAIQVFFSMSCCWGGLITLASYNKFHNNVFQDAAVVAVGDCLTSIFGGVVIFTIIGYMAHELGVEIEDVATQGAGLAFIVYPQVVTRLPIAPLWAVLFMLMLINLGLGTQFTLVTTTHTTLLDMFSSRLRKGRRPLMLLAAICVLCYSVGLFICSQGGMFVLQLMDRYAPSYGLLTIGIMETVVLGWVYGINRFLKDIEQMIGRKPGAFWAVVWKFVTPSLIVAILLFTFADFTRSTYGKYTFPIWSDILGWMISLLEIGCIPAVAIYTLATSDVRGSLWMKLKALSRPLSRWGPALEMRRGQKEELKRPLNTPADREMNDMSNHRI